MQNLPSFFGGIGNQGININTQTKQSKNTTKQAFSTIQELQTNKSFGQYMTAEEKMQNANNIVSKGVNSNSKTNSNLEVKGEKLNAQEMHTRAQGLFAEKAGNGLEDKLTPEQEKLASVFDKVKNNSYELDEESEESSVLTDKFISPYALETSAGSDSTGVRMKESEVKELVAQLQADGYNNTEVLNAIQKAGKNIGGVTSETIAQVAVSTLRGEKESLSKLEENRILSISQKMMNTEEGSDSVFAELTNSSPNNVLEKVFQAIDSKGSIDFSKNELKALNSLAQLSSGTKSDIESAINQVLAQSGKSSNDGTITLDKDAFEKLYSGARQEITQENTEITELENHLLETLPAIEKKARQRVSFEASTQLITDKHNSNTKAIIENDMTKNVVSSFKGSVTQDDIKNQNLDTREILANQNINNINAEAGAETEVIVRQNPLTGNVNVNEFVSKQNPNLNLQQARQQTTANNVVNQNNTTEQQVEVSDLNARQNLVTGQQVEVRNSQPSASIQTPVQNLVQNPLIQSNPSVEKVTFTQNFVQNTAVNNNQVSEEDIASSNFIVKQNPVQNLITEENISLNNSVNNSVVKENSVQNNSTNNVVNNATNNFVSKQAPVIEQNTEVKANTTKEIPVTEQNVINNFTSKQNSAQNTVQSPVVEQNKAVNDLLSSQKLNVEVKSEVKPNNVQTETANTVASKRIPEQAVVVEEVATKNAEVKQAPVQVSSSETKNAEVKQNSVQTPVVETKNAEVKQNSVQTPVVETKNAEVKQNSVQTPVVETKNAEVKQNSVQTPVVETKNAEVKQAPVQVANTEVIKSEARNVEINTFIPKQNLITNQNIQNFDLNEGTTSQNTIQNPLLAQGLNLRDLTSNQMNSESLTETVEVVESETFQTPTMADSLKNSLNFNSGNSSQNGNRNFRDNSRDFQSQQYGDAKSFVTDAGAENQTNFASSVQSASAVGQTGSKSQLPSIYQQLETPVVSAIKGNVSKLEVQLNPVELGALTVTLTSKNGEISAVIQSEKVETMQVMNQQTAALKRELESQGIKIESIEVELKSSDNNEFAQSQEQQNFEQQGQQQQETMSQQLDDLNRLRVLGRGIKEGLIDESALTVEENELAQKLLKQDEEIGTISYSNNDSYLNIVA